MNLSDFYSYRLIGKLTDFLQLQEFSLLNPQLKRRVGLVLTKEEDLRITLNSDGTPIISKSHTQPSHSQLLVC